MYDLSENAEIAFCCFTSIEMAPRVEELFLTIPLVLSIEASWERSWHEKIVLITNLEHR
jgi:hypothetical protein